MPVYRDEKKGTWYAAFYYVDWNGENKKKLKRGFPTKKAAQMWERQFLLTKAEGERSERGLNMDQH